MTYAQSLKICYAVLDLNAYTQPSRKRGTRKYPVSRRMSTIGCLRID